MVHTINLAGYSAAVQGANLLQLGTWDSYGIEQLQINPGPEWADLTITATFVTPTSSTRMVVPASGLVDVPPEATAQTLTIGKPGCIVFAGVSDSVQRISTNVYYTVANHATVEGSDPQPTPSEWEQFVAQVQQAAQQAAQSESNAAASATAAAGSADAAAEALEKVQGAGSSALERIGDAQKTALHAVNQAGETQTSGINAAGQAAAQKVQKAGTEQVDAVNKAGDAKIQQIEDINALLPPPSEADAGKAPIAQPDGTYALETVTVDAYTKVESDARYAPIAAAIRPTVSGNPATLEHSVAWAMQGLSMYGKSTQQTTTGAQLFDMKTALSNTWIVQNSGETETAKGYWTSDYIPVREGTYYLSYKGSNRTAVYDAEKTFVRYLLFSGGLLNINNGEAYIRFSGISNNPPETIMCNAGSTALPWEPYTGGKPSPSPNYPQEIVTAGSDGSINIAVSDGADQRQLLSIQTPNGLSGIPVDSGGNYTDSDGQQWVCDEVDFERGVYVQRVEKIVIDGEEMKFTQDASGGVLESSYVVSRRGNEGIRNSVNVFSA